MQTGNELRNFSNGMDGGQAGVAMISPSGVSGVWTATVSLALG